MCKMPLQGHFRRRLIEGEEKVRLTCEMLAIFIRIFILELTCLVGINGILAHWFCLERVSASVSVIAGLRYLNER